MVHTVAYNSRDNMVEVKVRGDLTLPKVKEIASEVFKVSKDQHCYFVLSDLSEATVNLSTMEIHNLPNMFSEMAAASGLQIYTFRRAFVAPKGLRDLNFFETVSLNRGQNAQYFFSVDEARKWLSER